MKPKLTIEQYLKNAGRFAGSDYGQMLRSQFADDEGSSELAMLVSPSKAELAELERAVAIMTDEEKRTADTLSDEQVSKIAADAQVDPGNLAIFFNGYALHCKKAE